MIHYPFPIITHLNDLLPALEGRDEIKVMERDSYQVVDYLYVLPDTFPSIPADSSSREWQIAVMRRECRGIIFDLQGNVVSRRLHKFFNMGEREEMLPKNIDFSRPHHILNKEDGSMCSPYMDPEERVKWHFDSNSSYTQKVFWGTMMGWTDVAQNCERFVETSNFDYDAFARMCLGLGWTPIFEWCSPDSRIVLRHTAPKLVLLAIRHNETGVYKSYEEVSEWADQYGVPVVASMGSVDCPAAKFMARIHAGVDTEGVVVQFDDGHCIKIKTAWYLRFHKAKENLVHEKDVINVIMEGDVDDIMPVLMEHDKERLITYQQDLEAAMDAAARHLIGQVNMMKAEVGDDRGAYAQLVKTNGELPAQMKGMAFKLFQPDEGTTQVSLIRNFVATSVGSSGQVNAMRKIVPVQPW